MQSASEILSAERIELRTLSNGNHRTRCPNCSHTRKDKRDPCLSVLIDAQGVQFNCWHCGHHGGQFYDGRADTGPSRGRPGMGSKGTQHQRRDFGQAERRNRYGFVPGEG